MKSLVGVVNGLVGLCFVAGDSDCLPLFGAGALFSRASSMGKAEDALCRNIGEAD